MENLIGGDFCIIPSECFKKMGGSPITTHQSKTIFNESILFLILIVVFFFLVIGVHIFIIRREEESEINFNQPPIKFINVDEKFNELEKRLTEKINSLKKQEPEEEQEEEE